MESIGIDIIDPADFRKDPGNKRIRIPYISKVFGNTVMYVDPDNTDPNLFRELSAGVIPKDALNKLDTRPLVDALSWTHSRTQKRLELIGACPLKAFSDYIEFRYSGGTHYFTTTFVNQGEADNRDNFYFFTPYVNGDGTLSHKPASNMEISGPYQTAIHAESRENSIYRDAVMDVFGRHRNSKMVTAKDVRAALGATG